MKGRFILGLSLTLLFILLIDKISIAQAVKVESLNVEDGLSQGYVSSILEDSRGFFWFATRDGLNRYDGVSFKHYRHSNRDSTSIVDNLLMSLAEDELGRIWITTYHNGLDCFNPQSKEFYHFGLSFNEYDKANIFANQLYILNDNELWLASDRLYSRIVGTDKRNLAEVEFESVYISEQLSKLEKRQPIILDNNGCYIYKDNKILRKAFDKSRFTNVELYKKNITEDPFVFENLNDSNFTWIYIDGKLKCYENGRIVKEYATGLKQDNDFRAYKKNYLYQDTFDNIWILMNSKLYKVNCSKLDATGVCELDTVISDPMCTTLYVDKSNKLWIGTTGYGVRIIDLNKLKFTNSFSNYSISSIYEMGEGVFQLGDLEATLNGQVLTESNTRKSIGNERVKYSINAGSQDVNDGSLTYTYKEKEKTIKNLRIQISKPFIDRDDNLWCFYDNDKLFIKWVDRDTVTYYSYNDYWKEKALSSVNSVYQSKDGKVYISCTNDLMEVTYDKNSKDLKFKSWNTNNDLEFLSNNILCTLDDPKEPDKYLWLGTSGGGLVKADKGSKTITHFNTDDGLPNNVVYGLLADEFNNLWVSTNYGLSRFNLAANYFKNYTSEKDGLAGNEFNTNAFGKHEDGRFMFGGVDGLTMFYPKDLMENEQFGEVYFTRLKINNKEVKLNNEQSVLKKPIEFTKEIDLAHDENFLTINYASLKSRNLGNTSFIYKMEGVDMDWVSSLDKTELSYPNLAPGNYTLKVADINDIGKTNPNYASLTFNIASPWWKSTLAYIIYILIGLSLLYWFFQNSLAQAKTQQELLFNEERMRKLKEVDQLKDRFFSNITHEFRSPLTLIIEPARKGLSSANQELKKQSRLVYNNANRLLLLVNQLLDISKLEERKMQISTSFGDIMPVVEEIYSSFIPMAEKNNLSLQFHTTLDEHPVNIDRDIIEKILFNLLSNAIKFTEAGGSIDLYVNSLNDDQWQLIVKDTGIGISKEDLPKIYDRFYQIDNSSTRQNEGSGIGMSLVKEFVDLMKGEILVESELNKGTTFTVTLPIFLKSGSRRSASLPSKSSGLIKEVLSLERDQLELDSSSNLKNAKAKILLVEDNQDLLDYMTEILLEGNYQVLRARNGKEGLSSAKEIMPDLIISDVMMPLMDGFQMLHELKTDILTSHIPIMLLTAKSKIDSKIEGYRKGASAYLTKPFHSEELLARLEQILKTREILQQQFQNKFGQPGQKASLEKLSESETQAKETPSLELTAIDKQWIKDLGEIVEEKILVTPFTVEDLSTACYMSRTQFFVKVKALTGLTPAALIRNTRLDLAHNMLVNDPKMTFAQIADEVGVTDAKYFRRLFIKKYGSGPYG